MVRVNPTAYANPNPNPKRYPNPNPKRNPNPSPNHDHNLDWANEKVEQRFKQLCTSPFHEDGRGKIVCFDGTGTHVERQKRRMYARSTARARTNTHMSAFT